MALFKPYSGPENLLNEIPLHPGYVYLSIDGKHMYADVVIDDTQDPEDEKNWGRVELNAYAADVLIKTLEDGSTKEVDIDNIVLKESLDVDKVILKTENNKNILIGSGTTLTGNGAVYTDNTNGAQVGILSLEYGGTGGKSASEARNNLDVYQKITVDEKIKESVKEATSIYQEVVLTPDNWITTQVDGKDFYAQSCTFTDAVNTEEHVPFECTYTSNLDEYTLIDHATSVGNVITFYTEDKPENEIDIILINAR